MGAATIPHRTTPHTTPHTTAGTGRWDLRGVLGVLFLAAGAVDAIFMGFALLLWILEPEAAPSRDAVIALPVMALVVLTAATAVRRRLADANRSADLLASTTRWWALFALLLSVPAILIISSL